MRKDDIGGKTLWVTPLVTIVTEEVRNAPYRFHVYKNNDQADRLYLGSFHPADKEEEKALIDKWNDGACPVADHWTTESGAPCTLEPWGTDEAPDLFDRPLWFELDREISENELWEYFFLDDSYGLLTDTLWPAYEDMSKNDPRPKEDGFFDLEEVRRAIYIDRHSRLYSGEMTRIGTAKCLVPFLGPREVTATMVFDLTYGTTLEIVSLLNRLEDEETSEFDRRRDTEQLALFIREIIACNEGSVILPEKHVFELKPIKQSTEVSG